MDPTAAAGEPVHRRLKMLDGWRALSILLVMASHMLPLGPARWNANAAIGMIGMAIFFTLSGFLIVSILARDPDIGRFLIRRISRILPLAWLALVLMLPLQHADAATWVANLLFYANLPPFWLMPWSTHFWSLCLEMQFYAAIALTVLVAGRRGLWLVPVAALTVTAARIATGTEVSIITWFRADEIMAGGILALAVHGDPSGRATRLLRRLPFWPIAILTLLSASSSFAVLNYLRPYLVATSVGITILRPVGGFSRLLESRPAAYIASISYALYVIHHFTLFGWLGAGHGWVKYAKRPLCLVITFALAHLSTFHFESRFIAWSHRVRPKRPVANAA